MNAVERENCDRLSSLVVASAYRVSNALGAGFLEKVYENAMAIVEIKAIDSLHSIHRAQCMNYLRATGLNVALLFNFGRPRIELKRIVWNF